MHEVQKRVDLPSCTWRSKIDLRTLRRPYARNLCILLPAVWSYRALLYHIDSCPLTDGNYLSADYCTTAMCAHLTCAILVR